MILIKKDNIEREVTEASLPSFLAMGFEKIEIEAEKEVKEKKRTAKKKE